MDKVLSGLKLAPLLWINRESKQSTYTTYQQLLQNYVDRVWKAVDNAVEVIQTVWLGTAQSQPKEQKKRDPKGIPSPFKANELRFDCLREAERYYERQDHERLDQRHTDKHRSQELAAN